LLREKPEQDALARVEVDHDKNRLRGPHAGSLGKATCPRSVIVVTHYSAGTIRRCLTSALRELGPKDELIVVDNVSLDDTQLIVHDRVRLLPNRENIGYSRGCNQGILASGGKKLILLNPDVIMAGGSVGRLVAPLHGDVFATGPLADNVGGAQFVAFHLGGQKPTAAELPGVLASSHAGESAEVKALMGFCLAVRRDVLDKHGLLCEETELGADDLELSWRLRELGGQLKIVLDAFVYHEGSHSFNHSPNRDMARVRIRRSDRALVRKLVGYYGWGNVPASMEIWGNDIFAEAFERSGVSTCAP
jgi:O-antigen biosynthesis protein